MALDRSPEASHTLQGTELPPAEMLQPPQEHVVPEQAAVVLPGREYGETFKPTLDTSTADGSPANPGPMEAKSRLTLQSRSLLLLRAPRLAADPHPEGP